MEQNVTFVMVPEEQWQNMITAQKDILSIVQELRSKRSEISFQKYLTVREFLKQAKIGRTKFDELIHSNKIKYIKKRRKIYIPISEIDRFFTDAEIQ